MPQVLGEACQVLGKAWKADSDKRINMQEIYWEVVLKSRPMRLRGRSKLGKNESMDLRKSQGTLLGWLTCPSLPETVPVSALTVSHSGKTPSSKKTRLVTLGPLELGWPCRDTLNCNQVSGPLCPLTNLSLNRRCPNPQGGITLDEVVLFSQGQLLEIDSVGSCQLLTIFSIWRNECFSPEEGTIGRCLILQ